MTLQRVGTWLVAAHAGNASALKSTVRSAGLLALMVLGIGGCGFHPVRTTPVGDLVARSRGVDPSGFTAQIGDVLTVRFYFDPELDFDALVRPDGAVSLSLVGDIPAAGHTFQDLSTTITDAYRKYLNQPNATVILRTPAGHRVYVTGEVNFPGVFTMQGNETALSVVSAAGGLTDRGSLKKVILVRRLPGQPVMVTALNLRNALDGKDPLQDVKIYLNDVVYVPRTGAAETNVVLKNLIWGKGPVGITAGAIWNGTIR
jgi:polysaccharide biosynthesis/export protein